MTGAKVRTGAAVLFLSASLFAQTPSRDVPPPPLTGTAVVAGTVLTGDGSAPVRRARVTISGDNARIDGQTATTDDDGRFEFSGLPAGRYTVSAFKPGYHRMNYGAAISGTVRDRRGRPLPDVPVSVLRIGYSGPGDRNFSPPSQGSTTTTDDRGAYRAWGLIPGEYLVMARPSVGVAQSSTGPAEFSRLRSGDVDRALARGVNTGAPEAARAQATAIDSLTDNWAPVFHPGTPIAESAVTIVLAGETERTAIDIVADAVPTTRVSGSVPMATQLGRGAVTVTLSATGDMTDMLTSSLQFRPQQTTAGQEGRFEFRNVVPGRYNVLAKTTPQQVPPPGTTPQPVLWAQSTIDVNGRPIDVSLALQPSITVTGRVVFEGTTPVPADLLGMQVRLVPPGAAGNFYAGPGGSVTNDGTFSLHGVTPGPYRLWVFMARWPEPWAIKSAIANGQNVLDGFSIGSSPIDIVVTFADRPAGLVGRLQDASGRPATDYFVVVFPVDPKLWKSAVRLISRRPATDGQFSIRSLLPGEYYVAALTDFQTEDMYTPSFLDGLTAFASRATIVEAQTTRLDLRIGK